MIDERRNIRFILPPDPWWPRRVIVANDGDCVPYHLMLLWHWQFFCPTEYTA